MFRQFAAGIAALVLALTGVRSGGDEFFHTDGAAIVSPSGEQTVLRGIVLGNDVWCGSLDEVGLHHNEDSFREISELGFNSVRFLLNYRWFEDDDQPFVYKQEGFDYIDRSIAWAKKYGVGMVLNMHYPQGGYQSLGNGSALWTDPQNQRRLVKLWGEIARRYADEPAITGYGLINEPVVPLLSTPEDTVAQCRTLMQRCTDEIRRNDRNHIIFAERVAAVKDLTTGESLWSEYEPDQLWFLLDDDNVVYETHYYEPHSFTHQSAGDGVKYPDPPYITDFESYWTGSISAEKTADGYFETELFSRGADCDLFAPALHSSHLGDGTAIYDDLAVTEYSPDGSSRVIWYNDFSDGCALPVNEWSSDGTGSYSVSGGRLWLTGGRDDYVLTFKWLELQEGYSYKVSGHMSAIGTDGFAEIRGDFSRAGKIYRTGREYTFENLTAAVKFGSDNNVPIYLGEFGADAESFKNGLGGERWVADVMDFCNESGISYNYHAYHEPMFGFYPEDTKQYPQHRNEALAQVFAAKNKNG